jgi:uncharacterized protein Yka (UPF0111/DUF47 family)
MMTLSEATTLFEAARDIFQNILGSATAFRDFAGNPEGREGSHAALVQARERASANRTAAIRILGQSTTFWRDLRPVGRLLEQACPIPALIEKTAARMKTYRIERPPAEVLELARCIERAAAILRETAEAIELNNAEGSAKGAATLRAAVEEADAIGSRGLGALFENPGDPLEILKSKDLYHLLGEILRRFQGAARRIESMAQGAE